MAMTQKERDLRRHAKAEKLQEEDLRLKVRPGTKQALSELMGWAGIEEQGEALTLMIHHVEALGRDWMLRIARHEAEGRQVVARTEVIRLTARPRTVQCLWELAGWASLDFSGTAEELIHGIHALGRQHAVKFLTPPQHQVSISPRLALAFSQKSMLMIQQDPGDEVISPA